MKTTVTKTIMALALTAMATFFAGCGPDEPDNPTPPTPTTVAVTGVSLNKSSHGCQLVIFQHRSRHSKRRTGHRCESRNGHHHRDDG